MHVTFRGAIVTSEWSRTWPLSRLSVHDTRVDLRHAFGHGVTVLPIEADTAVRLVQLRNPFMWRSVFWFRLDQDHPENEQEIGFVPFRSRALSKALVRAGVTVVGPRRRFI
jgi:phage gp29-like protein